MAQNLFGLVHRLQNSSGAIEPNATIEVYDAGTDTPRTVYSNRALTVAAGYVVTADSAGVVPERWIANNVLVKLVYKSATGTIYFTRDYANDLGTAVGYLPDWAASPQGTGWRKRVGWSTGSFEMDILDMSGPDYGEDINQALSDLGYGEELTLRSSTNAAITFDQTIYHPQGVKFRGVSSSYLEMRREGDIGCSCIVGGVAGSTGTGGEMSGIYWNHYRVLDDYDAAALQNPVTNRNLDAHVRIMTGVGFQMTDVKMSWLPIQLDIWGGARHRFRRFTAQDNIFAKWNAAMQEGVAAVRMRAGPAGDIATDHVFENCSLYGKGGSDANRDRDFSAFGLAAGNHATQHLCGALAGLLLTNVEGGGFMNGYLGAFHAALMTRPTQWYNPATGSAIGPSIVNSFTFAPDMIDGCAVAHFRAVGSGTATRIKYAPGNATGGNVTPYGLLADIAPSGAMSVYGLETGGQHCDYVAAAMQLEGAQDVFGFVGAENWNNLDNTQAEGATKKNWRSAINVRGTDYVIDGMSTSPALAIGSTTTRVANGAFDFRIQGSTYSKGAVVAGTALNAETTPAGKYGCQALDIDAAGTIYVISAPFNAYAIPGEETAGYRSAAQAVADLPDPEFGLRKRMGYITYTKSDGPFVAGTTALNASGVTTVYTNAPTGVVGGCSVIDLRIKTDPGAYSVYDVETSGVDLANDAMKFKGTGSGAYGRLKMNGDITHPTYEKFAMRAHKNGGDQTLIASDTPTPLSFPTSAVSQGGGWDTSDQSTTPPQGTYKIGAQARVTTNIGTGTAFLMIYKDGSELVRGPEVAVSGAAVTLTVECVDFTDGTDKYEIYISTPSSSPGVNTVTVSGDIKKTFVWGHEV